MDKIAVGIATTKGRETVLDKTLNQLGNETKIDYSKMIDLVKKAGYKGYVGIEYEGTRLSEDEGIVATKKLLEKLI